VQHDLVALAFLTMTIDGGPEFFEVAPDASLSLAAPAICHWPLISDNREDPTSLHQQWNGYAYAPSETLTKSAL
jgi:hypothetical protein